MPEASSAAQRRPRLQLSCHPCRLGKLKCSRELPCNQCTKRCREASCVYTVDAHESITIRTQARAMRRKLEQLERVIQTLQDSDSQEESAASSQGRSSDVPRTSLATSKEISRSSTATHSTNLTPGYLVNSDEHGQAFVGPSHWQSIFKDIAEVKEYLSFGTETMDGVKDDGDGDSDLVSLPSRSSIPDTILLAGSTITRKDLMLSVPPKAVADGLITCYFSSMDLYKPVIHLPTFLNQYHKFWQCSDVSPQWLALLFVLLALGFQYNLQTQRQRDPVYDSNSYVDLAAHAIVLADYTRPKAYTLEALILYVRCRQMQNPERQLKDWLTLGLVTRLSFGMGYHRDPSLYPALGPLESHMRRRIWWVLCFLDVSMSYQIGLVSSIDFSHHSVRLPENLRDSELVPGLTRLPPPRPLNDFTEVLPIIALGNTLPFYAESVRLSHAALPPDNSVVESLSKGLDEAEHKTMSLPVVSHQDQPSKLMCSMNYTRYCQELFVQKGRCILFRRYLGTDQMRFRKSCSKAAVRVLEIQKSMEAEYLPGGALCELQTQQMWDLMDAFVLAATIVAIEISNIRHMNSKQGDTSPYSNEEHEAMRRALQTSCQLCQVSSTASEKTKRAAEALEAVLNPPHAPSATTVKVADIHDTFRFGSVGNAQGVANGLQSHWPAASEDAAIDMSNVSGLWPPMSGLTVSDPAFTELSDQFWPAPAASSSMNWGTNGAGNSGGSDMDTGSVTAASDQRPPWPPI